MASPYNQYNVVFKVQNSKYVTNQWLLKDEVFDVYYSSTDQHRGVLISENPNHQTNLGFVCKDIRAKSVEEILSCINIHYNYNTFILYHHNPFEVEIM